MIVVSHIPLPITVTDLSKMAESSSLSINLSAVSTGEKEMLECRNVAHNAEMSCRRVITAKSNCGMAGFSYSEK